MALQSISGDRAPYKHVHNCHGASDAWMLQEFQRLSEIADDLGINTRIVSHDDRIELEFENVKDCALMRLRAFGNDYNPGQHIQDVNFQPGDDLYQEAYLTHARTAIESMGLACRIERNDAHQVSFRFDTVGDHALFTELIDRGVVHQLALADIGGPTGLQPI